jgi:uracil-DNA glycosylase
MDAQDRQGLLRTVYDCQSCPEVFGVSRPGTGRPYFKFPPMIGVVGRAELLFVGINPRRAGRENLVLHDRLMADVSAFEALARNRDGQRTYIAWDGRERHYQMHVQVVWAVFGPGARFEDHTAVTELFFCASAGSAHLPQVESPCAAKYFETVLRLVAPRVVVCVGARVFDYFRERYGRAGGPIRLGCGQAAADVVQVPHPNARMSGAEREQEMGAAVAEIRAKVSQPSV